MVFLWDNEGNKMVKKKKKKHTRMAALSPYSTLLTLFYSS